jgi:hypothetical protein
VSDYDSHCVDAMASFNARIRGMTANSTFGNPIDNLGLATDGSPSVSIYRTQIKETGLRWCPALTGASAGTSSRPAL